MTVTIPDDLYEQVESLACRQEQSRSDLYAQALEMLIHAQDAPDQPPSDPNRPEWLDWSAEEVTRNLNEYASQHDTSLDSALAEAQTRMLLENCEWE